MKNRQGIVLAPLLVIIGAVLVAGFAAYFLIQANSSGNENANVAVINQADNNINTSNTNSNQPINTNVAGNTNTAANTNTVSNTNTATDPTAAWKTYTNSKESFSFRYPNDWSVISQAGSGTNVSLVALRSLKFSTTQNLQGEVYVGRYTNTQNYSLEQYWNQVNDLGVTATPTPTTVNGYSAQRLDRLSNPDRFPSPRTDVHIKVPGKIFNFSIQNTNGNFDTQIETFNQILTTFQVTE